MNRSGYGVVITDFDGTLVKKDIALLVLRRYGLPGWRVYDLQLETGKISLEKGLAAQYAMIRAPSEQAVLRFARRHYGLRDGFAHLVESCRDSGVKVVVVSAGLDFLILDALDRFGLEVDRLVCPKSTFSPDGVKMEFPRFTNPARNFKEEVVARYRRRGMRCAFAGDGYSDVYPATSADTVFAVEGSVLERECKRNRIGYTPFTNFRAVEELLG